MVKTAEEAIRPDEQSPTNSQRIDRLHQEVDRLQDAVKQLQEITDKQSRILISAGVVQEIDSRTNWITFDEEE